MCDAVVEPAVQKGARDGGFDVDFAPRHHPGEYCRHSDIQHGADQQRGDDSDGQIALRVLGLLGGSRNCVEADVSEENVGRASADSRHSVRREGVPVRAPVAEIARNETQTDHKQNDRDFDHHDGGVEAGALLNAPHQHGGNDQGDDECRKIEADLHPEQMRSGQQIVRSLQQLRAIART